jgi:hypothetical protein
MATTQMTIYVSKQLYQRLRIHAATEGCYMVDIVREALKDYFKKVDADKKS